MSKSAFYILVLVIINIVIIITNVLPGENSSVDQNKSAKICKHNDKYINSENIHSLKNCNIIDADITITDDSFLEMHPNQLEVFSSVTEITGFLNIENISHGDFKNLSCFRNLRQIHGNSSHGNYKSLHIFNTTISSLNLRSLQSVKGNGIVITDNNKLCFVESINWDRISKKSIVTKNGGVSICHANDMLWCDSQCNDGCWGPGPQQCLRCRNYKQDNTCLRNCNSKNSNGSPCFSSCSKDTYEENGICLPCHEECEFSCFGPGADQCSQCKHVQDGEFCVDTCPLTKHEQYGECSPCSSECIFGCTKSYGISDPLRCKTCDDINNENKSLLCIGIGKDCPQGYYHKEEATYRGEEKLCIKCHPQCGECSGYGIDTSVCQHLKYKLGNRFVEEDECPSDHYANDNLKECIQRDPECRGKSEMYWAPIYIALVTIIMLIFVMGTFMLYNRYIRCEPEHQIAGENENEMESVHILENTMLIRSAKPDLTPMNKEAQTNYKSIVKNVHYINPNNIRDIFHHRQGTFTEVYRGKYFKSPDDKEYTFVSIRKLSRSTKINGNHTFWKQVETMIKLDHPNIRCILGISIYEDSPIIIDKQSLLSNLREYLTTRRSSTNFGNMLEYCTKIAEGMAYLEDNGWVHRDLSALEVVKTRNNIKIKGFGIADLADIVYGGDGDHTCDRMPIQWKAVECIRNRTFNNKTDVWAYGVTIWEVLTFGNNPYDDILPENLLEQLLLGQRLLKPKICSEPLYNLMQKCWRLNPTERPTFKAIVSELKCMSLQIE